MAESGNSANMQIEKQESVIVVNSDLKLEGGFEGCEDWKTTEDWGTASVSLKNNLQSLGATVESVFDPSVVLLQPERDGSWGNCENGFVTAVRIAYAYHVPLSLSPDHIWTLIVQGLSSHIAKNSEKLRDKFVEFDGKKLLRIERDNFVKGSQENDWAGCFEEFSKMISEFIGEENKAKLCPSFSTTTATEQACKELALMDCMKSYFDYRVRTKCGISKVKLLGSPDDWKSLEKSLEAVREFGMPGWADALAPILNNLSRAACGEEVDKNFWDTIYKPYRGNKSGAHPTVDGWMTNFFPFINGEVRKQPFRSLDDIMKSFGEKRMWHPPGIPQTAVPIGLAKTPFIWEYLGNEIKMNFYGGFVGATMEGGYVTPVIGWAVGEQKE